MPVGIDGPAPFYLFDQTAQVAPGRRGRGWRFGAAGGRGGRLALQVGDAGAQLGVRLDQQAQRLRRTLIEGVLLLDNRVDVPAQPAAHHLVHQDPGPLVQGAALQRPVGADHTGDLQLLGGVPQLALEGAQGRVGFLIAAPRPPGAHLGPQGLENGGNIGGVIF
jgi:hypothetical protein